MYELPTGAVHGVAGGRSVDGDDPCKQDHRSNTGQEEQAGNLEVVSVYCTTVLTV